jgi:hypothetical protein
VYITIINFRSFHLTMADNEWMEISGLKAVYLFFYIVIDIFINFITICAGEATYHTVVDLLVYFMPIILYWDQSLRPIQDEQPSFITTTSYQRAIITVICYVCFNINILVTFYDPQIANVIKFVKIITALYLSFVSFLYVKQYYMHERNKVIKKAY